MRRSIIFTCFSMTAGVFAAISCSSGDSDSGCPEGTVLCADGRCYGNGVPCPEAVGGTGGGTGLGGGPSSSGGQTSATGGAPVSGSDGGIIIPDAEPVSATCPDAARGSGTFTNAYDGRFVNVVNSDKQYYLATNWWSLGTQAPPTVRWDGLSFSLSNMGSGTTSNAPIGYPSLFIGHYQGHRTAGSNLPKRVGDINRIPTALLSNATQGASANYNVAYDVWFTDGGELTAGATAPPAQGAFLMVWLFDPSGRQPRGSNRRPGATISGVPGSWDVWVDSTQPPCISYVSTSFRNSLEFDLNHFIRDGVSNGYLNDNMDLAVIFGGTEVWNGGEGLSIDGFCAIVE